MKSSSLDTTKVKINKLTILIPSIVLGIIFLIAFTTIAIILNSNTIYPNVIILGNDVGGYTKNELIDYLGEELSKSLSNMTLTLSDIQFEKTIQASDLGVKIDIGSMADKAYSAGREGNIIARLSSIMRLRREPLFIKPIIDASTEKYSLLIDEICNNAFKEIKPSNIVITEDKVLLCTGTPGREVERGHLEKLIEEALIGLESKKLVVPVVERMPPVLDIDSTLNALNKSPVNAEFIRTSRTTYKISPHQIGYSLERSKLIDIINYVENREANKYEEIILPVEFLTPDITEEKLKSQIFRDTLSSYTTYFNTHTENNYNRGINIGLATNSIDGTIILPGETFSFNDVVGPRTPEKGYRIAHVFIDGQIKDGTGGGICQVSTTLYNVALLANLDIVERHNHMFTVSYVPLGHDAAVSYGYADLAFKNTTKYPLRINALVNPAGSLTFSISCTNDYPGLSVKLATKIISTTPIKSIFVNDSTLPKGTEVIAEKGIDGYVVDTFIKVYNGQELIKEEKIHRSVYQMYPRKVLKGDG